MLRKLVNQADVEMTLEPAEPLLIASGIPNAAGIDLPFVVTYRSGSGQAQPYLPGSSLKGVLRSHAERISRTVAQKGRVCDPHLHPRSSGPGGGPNGIVSCGDELGGRRSDSAVKESHELYARSCPICRTFGSTVYRGRLAVSDAYLRDGVSPRLERRDGVGIDRFSGGASHGVKFEMEILTQGVFRLRLRLENFEDWQLGLLALLCRDLEDEMISIGHATTRGLGRLRGKVEQLRVLYVVPPSKARELQARQVRGIGSLLDAVERRAYGLADQDRIELRSAPPLAARGIRQVQSFDTAEQRAALFDDAIGRWAERMDGWCAPQPGGGRA